MLTPFGNPQNLYLYDFYNYTPADFFGTTLPVFAVSAALILVLCLLIKNVTLGTENTEEVALENKRFLAFYVILFILCLLAVFGFMDVIVVFASVCVVAIILDMRLFTAVDYSLLLTFASFFVFVGNLQNMPAVNEFVTKLVEGQEFLASTLVSQVISNVPAAVLLSGFTADYAKLMIGVNLGGMGTIIASMASLISFKAYACEKDANKVKYLLVFTVLNVVFLGMMILTMLIA
jgi:Na+/H+ antiporter NhaD/arsenite permease-like protein